MYTENDVRFDDFMAKYLKVISPQYNELEETRYFFGVQGVCVLFISALFLILFYNFFFESYLGIIFLFILPLLLVGYAVYICHKYRKYLKKKILYKVMQECFSIKIISEEPKIFESGLWSKEDLYISRIGDCFKMIYKNLECKIYELTLSSKNKNWSICRFNGVVIQLPNNKKLNGIVKFKSKNSFNLLLLASIVTYAIILLFLFCFGDNTIKILNIFFVTLAFLVFLVFLKYAEQSRYEKKINSMDFKNDFEVYADDISDAKTEVTPKFITKIYHFKSRFKGKSVSCSFYDDKILFAVNGGIDLFEIGNLVVPINKPMAVYNFYKDVNMLYEIMDYLFK